MTTTVPAIPATTTASAIDQGAAAVSTKANEQFTTAFSSYQPSSSAASASSNTGRVPVSTSGPVDQYSTTNLSKPATTPALPQKKKLSAGAIVLYLLLALVIIFIIVVILYFVFRSLCTKSP